MIITFCGSSYLFRGLNVWIKIVDLLFRYVKENNDITLYCGGYGDFDYWAAKAGKMVKTNYPNIKIVYVTPYNDENYIRKATERVDFYDDVLYPNLDNVPKRLAILKRNYFMVDKADVVITCLLGKTSGGAYTTYQYAKRKGKKIIDIDDKMTNDKV